MKNKLFTRALSYMLCGSLVLSSPAMLSFAENALLARNSSSGIGVYITTTPKIMVGDKINANISGINNLYGLSSAHSIQWYRTSSGSTSDGVAIEGATGRTYTYTDEDIGNYVYALVSGQDENGEDFTLATNMTDKAVSEHVAESENWITSADGLWQYDILDGTENIQIKITERDIKGEDVVIPSVIDGHTVTKLADNCFKAACLHTPASSCSYDTDMKSLTLPNTIEELGSNLYIRPYEMLEKLVLPESVKYVHENAFNTSYIYTYNDGETTYYRPVKKIIVENPTCHFDSILGEAWSSVKDTEWLVAADGSSIHNMYKAEMYDYWNAGIPGTGTSRFIFEKSGVYNAESNSVAMTADEQLQQKLYENIKEWQLTPDGKFYYDVIDGTNELLLKPIEITDNSKIEFTSTVEGIGDVAAIEAETEGKSNVILDIPAGVIIDKSNSSLSDSTVISGNAGSNAEEYAKENNLIFNNKDNELTSKEEYDAAEKSNWFNSEDGYWQYRFIDGFNSVEIQNIKSFGKDAEVEVPAEIDGYKTSIFNGLMPDTSTTYATIILPESVIALSNHIICVSSSAVEGMDYYAGAKNIIVYNRNCDLSAMNTNLGQAGTKDEPTTITGYIGSTADLICKNRYDGTTNTDGLLTKSIFIPLDDVVSLENINITGTTKEGQTLTANLTPSYASVDYSWMVSDDGVSYTEIENTNAKTFIVPTNYTGKYLKVKATGLNSFSGTVISDAVQIAAGEAVKLNSVSIDNYSSSKKIGDILSTTISPTGATATYQWYRDKSSSSSSNTGIIPSTAEVIEGATESTYTLTAEDADYYVFVVATGTGLNYGSVKSNSLSYKISGNVTNVKLTNVDTSRFFDSSNNSYVGHTISAMPNSNDTNTVYYQWYRDTSSSSSNSAGTVTSTSELIEGATESTYTLTDEEFGKYVYVVIQGKTELGYGGKYKSASNVNAIYSNITNITVKNTNTSRSFDSSTNSYVGHTIEATATTNPTTMNDVSFQWYRSSSSVSSYGVGGSLTVYNNFDNSYLKNAELIEGATESTYTLTKEDFGKYVFVVATGINGTSGKFMSASNVNTIQSNITNITFTSSGSTSQSYVGDLLTATATTNPTTMNNVSFQWYRSSSSFSSVGVGGSLAVYNNFNANYLKNAEAIEGATESTYTVTTDDSGYYLAVVATGEGDTIGKYINYINSRKVKGKITNASIDGFPYVGEELTANFEPAEGTATYQWYRSSSATSLGTAISGATSKTYTVPAAYENYYIAVQVSGSGYYTGSQNAWTSSKITERIITPLDSITLLGTAKTGETLTAIVEPADATVSYDWYMADAADSSNWTKISSTSENTYTLTDAEIGKFIKVVATGTGDYAGEVEAITSESVADNIVVEKINKVTISGSAKSGETLKANVYPSGIDTDIIWLASDEADGDYVEIGTGSTFTLTDAEVGKYIKVEATNKADSSDVVLSSSTSKVVASSTDDTNTDEYGRIIDSIENVDYVTEDMDESAFTGTEQRDVLVYASQGQHFVVRIPKKLTFDGSTSEVTMNFETEVIADISGNDTITVEPEVRELELSESTGIKKNILCSLGVGQTSFSIAEDTQEVLEAGKVANHTATVTNLSAGSWRGTFNWLIKARGKRTENSEENVE